MSKENVIFYGVSWCWDCRRARNLLKKHNIHYEYINIDADKQAEEFVLKVNNGMRSVPTIVFPDGKILVEPSNSQLKKMLDPNLNSGQ